MNRYWDFNTTDENYISDEYNVANGITIHKALLATSRYSYFMLFRNSKSDYEVNFFRNKESDEMLIDIFSSSVVVKFNSGFQ